MNRTYAALLMSLSLAASPLVVNAESTTPDATLEISGKTVAVGVGFTEAKGTLRRARFITKANRTPCKCTA